MHVHELNPNRTTAVLIVFVLIIVVGLLTIRTSRLKYTLSPENTIVMVESDGAYFSPENLESVLNDKGSNTLLFDIRNNFVYGRGHIPGAENVSAIDLLNEENIERLENLKKEGVLVVLYANNQLEANGPWMVLRQLGFDNVKILLGGYEYYTLTNGQNPDSVESKVYLLGSPRYNYAEIFESSAMGSTENIENKPAVTVVRKKKTSAKEGGC
ncbi:MAG TPA: rhodanese-like domain-containing protein [Bacteroidales bacterium]